MYMRATHDGTLFPKDRCVVSFDGTHLGYAFRGSGSPTIVLCAGYCCPDNFWRYLAPALARRYRVLIWNYRGCGVSGMPREPGYLARNYTVEDFMIDRYARDLKAILDHEKVSDVVLLGHSMGTQVALECFRFFPERVRAFVSITGPYASAIHTFYNSTLAPKLYPLGRRVLGSTPFPLKVPWRWLFQSWLPHPLAIRVGALGPGTKEEDMRPYYDHMALMDPLIMLKMADAMHRHTAEDLLRKVEVPSLVIVGERDNFVPPWLGHVMVSRIPVAELVTIPGGTHGTIVEHPRVVNRTVMGFLERHIGKGRGRVASLDARRAQRARRSRPMPARARPATERD